MIAARQIAFGKAAGKGLSAKSYIQDGLVAMWDGIENAGWGEHDSDTLIWKDLVGNNDVVSLTALSQDTRFWKNNAFCFASLSGVGLQAVPDERLKQAFYSDSLYIEAVCSTNGFGNNNSVLLQSSNGTTTDGVLFGSVNSQEVMFGKSDSWASDRIRVAIGSSWNFNNRVIKVGALLGEKHQEVFVSFFDNGETKSVSADKEFVLAQDLTSLYLGSYSWTSGRSRLFLGDINNIKIYSRALTAEEIAHNNTVDKARFGL